MAVTGSASPSLAKGTEMAIAPMPVGIAKGIAGEMEIVPRHATFVVKEIARTVTGIAPRVRVTDLDFEGNETAPRPLETFAARETAEEIAPTFVDGRMIAKVVTEAVDPMVVATNALARSSNKAMP